MIQPSRNKVLWLGEAPPGEVIQSFKDWGLSIADPSLPMSDQSLRAVMIRYQQSKAGLIRKQVQSHLHARDYGVLVAVVVEGTDGRVDVAHRLRSVIAEPDDASSANIERIRTLEIGAVASGWTDIVRECVLHDPGPSANLSLKIGPSSLELTATQRILIQRAFEKSSSVHVSAQSGGRSGSRVLRVDSTGPRGLHEPFIAKIGSRLDLKEESDTFREHVRDFLAFPFRPSLKAKGFVEGMSESILCSMFISRSVCLDRYVCSVQYPELVIASLFDGPLRAWRANRTEVTNSLGRIYVERAEAARTSTDKAVRRPEREVLPDRRRLGAAFRLARRVSPRIPNPGAVWGLLLGLPSLTYSNCPCHGDLNARNVFVRSNSTDTILIDFSHAGDSVAASRDPSRLDVNLGFDVGFKGLSPKPMLSSKVLVQLYSPPLIPVQSLCHEVDGRIEAIRQIRRQAAGEGIRDDEYCISVACHLLRYARSGGKNTAKRECGPREESRLRALSYRLAVKLIQSQIRKMKSKPSSKEVL